MSYNYVCFTDDIAVDWVSNKLYWVDAVWARIEVMDLETLNRTQILRTGPNTSPRAIAVEPINRFVIIPTINRRMYVCMYVCMYV